MLEPLSPQPNNPFDPILGFRARSEIRSPVNPDSRPLEQQTEPLSPSGGDKGSISPADSTDNPLSAAQKKTADVIQLSDESRELAKLVQRDRDVRTHEAAHAAVGGPYAGSPSLTYKSGPDGRFYAVGGEVSIDLSPVLGDPRATIEKAQTVRAAALAPIQPSAQDMRVAARAMQMAAKAYAELSAQSSDPSISDRSSKNSVQSPAGGSTDETGSRDASGGPESLTPTTSPSPERANLSVYG